MLFGLFGKSWDASDMPDLTGSCPLERSRILTELWQVASPLSPEATLVLALPLFGNSPVVVPEYSKLYLLYCVFTLNAIAYSRGMNLESWKPSNL